MGPQSMEKLLDKDLILNRSSRFSDGRKKLPLELLSAPLSLLPSLCSPLSAPFSLLPSLVIVFCRAVNPECFIPDPGPAPTFQSSGSDHLLFYAFFVNFVNGKKGINQMVSLLKEQSTELFCTIKA